MTHEVSGHVFVEHLRGNGGIAYRWTGGFWCASPEPAGFAFGDSPAEPWVGSVTITQLAQDGAFEPASTVPPPGSLQLVQPRHRCAPGGPKL